jgi:hypothetical protein
MSIRKAGKQLLIWTVLAGAVLVTAASAESNARIVRLSNVEGGVQMDRGTGDGFEKAFLNLPVIGGSKLRTGSDGRVEVEFEDGSVLHVVPDSEVDFTRLSLGDDGQKLSTVELIQGTAYVNFRPKKGDRFTFNFAHESVALTEAAHFRVDLSNSQASVAVFQGDLEVVGPAGQVEVAKKHSATFDLGNNGSYELAKNYQEDPYDNWDNQQSEYHDRYAKNSTYDVSSPYAYGVSDLNYYGNYMNVPGYGWGWQPYFIGANWSPFQDGGWVWYPGYGYMWVSSYPWGWMPYRYGNWAFLPGYGWFWQPGYWNTWYAVPRVVNPPKRTPVPQPPIRSHQTVMVGQGLTVNPAAGPPRRLTITPGLAGLNVPRGSVRHLDRFAKEVEQNPRPMVVTTQRPVGVAPMPPSPRATGDGSSRPGVRSSPPVGATRMPAPTRTSPSPPPSKPH